MGAYLTYQVRITDLVELAGLDLGPLSAADRLPMPAPTVRGDARWRRLNQLTDLVL